MPYFRFHLYVSSELNSPIPVHLSVLIPKMLIFTLAISCLTTSNLPLFLDLTFQVPMKYCSLQHQTLVLSPVPSTTECCFCFGCIPSFFHSFFPLITSSILGTYQSGEFIVQRPIMLFMRFSRQEYWSALPLPSPVDHILSDCSSMTHSSWVAPHGMA